MIALNYVIYIHKNSIIQYKRFMKLAVVHDFWGMTLTLPLKYVTLGVAVEYMGEVVFSV